jgi:hypothetical protein
MPVQNAFSIQNGHTKTTVCFKNVKTGFSKPAFLLDKIKIDFYKPRFCLMISEQATQSDITKIEQNLYCRYPLNETFYMFVTFDISGTPICCKNTVESHFLVTVYDFRRHFLYERELLQDFL